MVDQAARDISSMAMNMMNLSRNIARDKREKTLFDQGQEEREAQIMARQEVLSAYTKAGVVDENGNITDQGYQTLMNQQGVNKGVATKALVGKGKHAYAYLKAQTEFTGQLLQNANNMKNLHMLAFNRADETYKNVITPSLKAAEISVGRGNREMAAQNIANAIMGANHRVRAKAVGDKIETWRVVNGEKQPSQTLTIEDAFALAKDYTRENYVPQAAAEIVAGYESNKNPQTFVLQDPKSKKEYRAVQIFRADSTVDYIFFNKDGSVAKDAPHDLEQAYQKGWTQVTAKGRQAAADLKYKEAQTAKIIKETGEVGKEKPEKPKKDAGKDDGKKYGEKRMKYIDDAVETFRMDNAEASPEEVEKVKKDAEARFNTEVMGWTPVGRNKKTGEVMYQTPEGKTVNSYGREMQPKVKLESAHGEKAFQRWYAKWAKKLGLSSNPDDPKHHYDYRAAFKAGAKPDKSGHWPSKFKKKGHPRMVVDGINTRTGKPYRGGITDTW